MNEVRPGQAVQGSAIYCEDGSYLFTPYEKNNAENIKMLVLATTEHGKLECSKKKVRMVLTIDRTDPITVISSFMRAFTYLARVFQTDKRVKKMYAMAEKAKPHEIEKPKPKEDDVEIPTFG